MKLSNSRVIGVCLIISASILTVTASQADTQSFDACVKKSTGAVRIITGKMKCYRSERLVTWTSTSDGLVGPAGPTGATGATGPAGATGAVGPVGPTGLAGANGLTGAQGIQGVAGPAGANGTNGTNGVNGISKALVATGNQVSINQGSSGTVLTANIPAGKYFFDLVVGLSYTNAGTSMPGLANLNCFLSSNSNYIDAASTSPELNLWPTVGNATPNRITFEAQPANSEQIMFKPLSGNGLISLSTTTSVSLVCRHYSSVSDDVNEKVTFYAPRLVLTAVDEIVTLN